MVGGLTDVVCSDNEGLVQKVVQSIRDHLLSDRQMKLEAFDAISHPTSENRTVQAMRLMLVTDITLLGNMYK